MIKQRKGFDIDGKNKQKVSRPNFKDGREQPIQYGHDKTITVWLYQKNK